jgi:hypothetical protein
MGQWEGVGAFYFNTSKQIKHYMHILGIYNFFQQFISMSYYNTAPYKRINDTLSLKKVWIIFLEQLNIVVNSVLKSVGP